MADPHWRDQARCVGVGAEAFFASTRTEAAAAISICQRCPVLLDCGETVVGMSITNGVHAGVWFGNGGTRSSGTVARAREAVRALVADLKAVS